MLGGSDLVAGLMGHCGRLYSVTIETLKHAKVSVKQTSGITLFNVFKVEGGRQRETERDRERATFDALMIYCL